MANNQAFSIKWDDYKSNIASGFRHLLEKNKFTDVTIECQGEEFDAHKIVLSACSPFFKDLFEGNPTSHVVILDNVPSNHLEWIINFMYGIDVNMPQEDMVDFFKTAGHLRVRGLTEDLL